MPPADVSEATLTARVGATIRGLREKAGLSTRELARRAGISQPFLSQIERGVSAPSMVTTYRLAEALGVLPGALLPAPASAGVTVVRAGGGRAIPVAGRADAAVGRALLMRPDHPLEVIDYMVRPGEYLGEWFQSRGELAMYLVSGQLQVQVEGAGSWLMAPGDLISHDASMRHRWLLVGDEAAHVLCVLSHALPG